MRTKEIKEVLLGLAWHIEDNLEGIKELGINSCCIAALHNNIIALRYFIENEMDD